MTLFGLLLVAIAGCGLVALAFLREAIARESRHPWDQARFDRLYEKPDGTSYVLPGDSGHTSDFGFHHGPRSGCLVCRDGAYLTTSGLPRRFPEPKA